MYDLNEAPSQHAESGDHGRAPSSNEIITQFRVDALQRGVLIPADVVFGTLTRCNTTGRNGEGDAAYLLHVDGIGAGGFENHQDGLGWQKWRFSGPLTRPDRAELQRAAKANLAAKAERERLRAEGEAKARAVWDGAIDDYESCAYLQRKRIQPHGARRQHSGYGTIVPMHDAEGVLRNVQTIYHDGEKRFTPNAPVAGLRYIIGEADGCEGFVIGEGFATVASVVEALDRPAVAGVVAFTKNNLFAIATSIRACYPDKGIMLLADDDRHLGGNPGLTKARAAAEAVNGWLAVPRFGDHPPEGATDFDDVRQLYGPDVVKHQLQQATRPGQPQIMPPDATTEVTPPAHTQAAVAALIESLDPRYADSEGQLSTITMALEGIASLQLMPVMETALLKQIKARSGMPITPLREQLVTLKRAIGIRPTATAATTTICRRYVFVKAINAFWDRDSRTIFPLDAIRNAHYHEMPTDEDGVAPIDPIDVLIKGRMGPPCDKVDIISFVPGEKEIFQEDESVALNIWTKPDIVPIEGDVTPFIDHVTYVLDGDHQIVEYLLDFLAHLVQRPAIKIRVTVLIIGDPGIGKSIIGEMLCTLVGLLNTTAIEESDLTSPFNEWMDGVQLVLVNELMTVDKRAAMNRLKSYITDPWLRINRKNVPTYKYRNRANFFMCSNYEDAAKIEKGDRRYLIWISKAKPRDKKYYADFRAWFDRGGAERLLHFLLSRDLSRFDPNTAPPITAAKLQVIDDSREPHMAYFQDAFDSGAPPFRHDLVAVNHIIDWLTANRNIRVTHKQVTAFLRQIGGEPLGQKRIGDGYRAVVWAIRNAAEWAEAGDNLAKVWKGMDVEALTDAERNAFLGRT